MSSVSAFCHLLSAEELHAEQREDEDEEKEEEEKRENAAHRVDHRHHEVAERNPISARAQPKG